MKGKFNQLCVWPGTVVGKDEITALEAFFKDEMDVTIKYETQVKTLPDETGPGGRNDLFFYVADDDIGKFAVPRLSMGIRWWEDVLGNGNGKLYPEEILEKYPKTWQEKFGEAKYLSYIQGKYKN